MEKRLFIGLSVEAPWPATYPNARILEKNCRHITLAFLGNVKMPDLESFPVPSFFLGPTAKASHVEFLPELKPRVVAYHVDWVSGEKEVMAYRMTFYNWLENQGFTLDQRPFHPHMTIARAPFLEKQWETTFHPLPLMVTGVHLYESVGNLRYPILHSVSLLPIFEEFEHTADIAFNIRGKDYNELYAHAIIAMSFEYPTFLTYMEEGPFSNLDEVVKKLNQMVAYCDRDHGCPFKAVSYHGKLYEEKGWMKWEMIVDV